MEGTAVWRIRRRKLFPGLEVKSAFIFFFSAGESRDLAIFDLERASQPLFWGGPYSPASPCNCKTEGLDRKKQIVPLA